MPMLGVGRPAIGDPALEAQMYEANRLVRTFDGPVPSSEWTAVLKTAEIAKSRYIALMGKEG